VQALPTFRHTNLLELAFCRSLSNFQRLLILKALRPDKFVPAVASFVTATLGPQFTEPPPFNLASAFADSSATTPLLFVLSPGTDPTASLLSFAESRGQSGGKLQVRTIKPGDIEIDGG
jgi:dynein heavy chain